MDDHPGTFFIYIWIISRIAELIKSKIKSSDIHLLVYACLVIAVQMVMEENSQSLTRSNKYLLAL